jgi:prolyl-tRNA editing enzyme YbaK/EbsC (Cys-tRNA(Pro) deacylase)
MLKKLNELLKGKGINNKTLSEDETIVFLAGNHKESIKMQYKDYAGIVKPNVEEFAVKLH